MLILTRKVDEAIVISDDITVTVLEISGERVKLGIAAPREVSILRQELLEEVREANIEAAGVQADLRRVAPKLKRLKAPR